MPPSPALRRGSRASGYIADRLRVEEAVLDCCAAVAAPAAIDLVLRATQRRLTTADRLRHSMQRRRRQRWRSMLLDVLAEVQVGVASNLSLAYRRDVEQRHQRPAGLRNEAEVDGVAIPTAMIVTGTGTSSSSWTAARLILSAAATLLR